MARSLHLKPPPDDPKPGDLRRLGILNPDPAAVQDRLFTQLDFFDARDMLQVKYEMLRRVQVDGDSVTHAAAQFGFSRPAFYEALSAFERAGLAGLLPKKRGPKGARKVTGPVLGLLRELLAEDSHLTGAELAARIETRLGLHVHVRTVERAVARERLRKKRR